jgi:hypothetical protein
VAAWCEVVWEVKWEQGGIDSGVAVWQEGHDASGSEMGQPVPDPNDPLNNFWVLG